MWCELLNEEVTAEACAECWDSQMKELAEEFEARRLLVGKPRTITHNDCTKENILKGECNEQVSTT